MDIEKYVNLYFDEKKRIIDSFPVKSVCDAVTLLLETYNTGGSVFIMGNGGNAGTADHIYCDFKHHPFVSESKTEALGAHIKRLKVYNVCASSAELTGLMNDLGAENVFASSMEPFLQKGDLVFGFSGSGNSPNILKAFALAKRKGAKVLSITKGDGGKSKDFADVCVLVPGHSEFPGQTGKNDNNFHFEDAVLYVSSIMVGLLKKRVSDEHQRNR